MSAKSDYLNSLTIDELRQIAWEFYDWNGNDGCPLVIDGAFKCPAGYSEEEQEERDCHFDECAQAEHGCWLKYYVWRYWQKNIAKEQSEQSLETLAKIGLDLTSIGLAAMELVKGIRLKRGEAREENENGQKRH